ncbi:hypothetical protein RO3G_03000 [Rhizopus delemar RA 99-880]|uniref:Uncharacterized protein n=1 Tax=Rhizopus delemar (strain RA 99-880 / ATCC MYA-4621 / FGSC 9543 / NRRL 43880) TaxID=246409 RepID=I1BQ16_RHIO9|nr:hypothetical protein RO3G_03000 [Rhizopus delemar RA 99-880]|eukprot:EIE78296.1 hypothetical protein RO3G_03000 [Rhizopus delemar RA 99-880]
MLTINVSNDYRNIPKLERSHKAPNLLSIAP